MSLLRQMFGGSKKRSSNKENDPKRGDLNRSNLHGLERISEDSMLEDHSRRHMELAPSNPYSIVTAPRTTRGPQSCPGGVQRDFDHRALRNTQPRHELNASLRMDVRRPKQDKRRVQYDDELDWEEEEEPQSYVDQRMAQMERKLNQYKRRDRHLREELANVNAELSDRTEQEVEWRRTAAYYEQRYLESQRQLGTERAKLKRLTKELKKANDRVHELEADSGNDSAHLLLASRHSQHSIPKSYTSDSGAGEALCNITAEPLYENEKQPLSLYRQHNFNTEDFDREGDEVRNYRNRNDGPGLESARAAHEHVSLSRQTTDTKLSGEGAVRIRRAASDTDITSVDRAHANKSLVESMAQCSTSATPKRRNHMDEPFIPNYDTSSASSGDERCAIIQRQLRRRGECVRYNPPRQQMSQRHFKPKFSKYERDALAEFNYLIDMSTDVSGLLSSPDAKK
ncbi:unnamed protein product, partial [Mesorhabditis spiculigera]